MVRSFGVRAYSQGLVCNLASDLDKKLIELQQNGCKIISVVDTHCKEWEPCRGYFDSTLFTIIAEHKEKKTFDVHGEIDD